MFLFVATLLIVSVLLTLSVILYLFLIRSCKVMVLVLIVEVLKQVML